ncbi:MAG: sigma-70 family RNA polymerase sigma factor [Planctomycetes bacterium]|nr:sigma-70 family RNA polymerase sigma factor [Planctomycetota bacterium]
MGQSSSVTQYLQDLASGDSDAAEGLLPLVYEELRALAERYLHDQPRGHVLQATALVHEAYIRLVGNASIEWKGRAHFFTVAATAMRRILVDYARHRCAAKRGGDRRRISLNDVLEPSTYRNEYLVALDDALTELAAVDPQLGRLVELRFFGGLSIEETAQILEVSPTTIKRLWKIAKGWLHRALSEEQ